MPINDSILETLVKTGIISEEAVIRFLEERNLSKGDGLTVASLLQCGLISDEQVIQCLSLKHRFNYTNLQHVTFCQELICMIPTEVARLVRMIPYKDHRGNVSVATEDPSNPRLVEAVNFFFGDDVKIAIATASSITRALNKYYPEPQSKIGISPALTSKHAPAIASRI